MLTESADTDVAVVAKTFEDKEQFAVLISRYEAKLGRYLRRLGVVRPEDRHDLLQDIFIKAYRNLHQFDTSLSFSAWIYRIAHNETMSWFRKRKARPEGHALDDGETALGFLVGGENADAAHMSSHDRETIGGALHELPAKYRDILVLRFFEERTYEEIADILQIPMGTVATLVFRAKDRLKRLLIEKGYVYGN